MKAVYKDEEWRPVLDGWIPQEKRPWDYDLIQIKNDGYFGPTVTKWADWGASLFEHHRSYVEAVRARRIAIASDGAFCFAEELLGKRSQHYLVNHSI